MNMNVKTLVFDMDGTILNDEKELDKVLIDISPKLQEKGIQLIIASGRLTYMTYIYLNELQINNAPIVACNGAQISYRDAKDRSAPSSLLLAYLTRCWSLFTNLGSSLW